MLDLLQFMQHDGYLSAQELTALRRTCKELGETPVRLLRSLNIASPEQIQKYLQKHYKLLTLKEDALQNLGPDYQIYIPLDIAIHFSCFGLGEDNDILYVALEDPSDRGVINQLRFLLNKRVVGVCATVYQLAYGLTKIYNLPISQLKLTTAIDRSRGVVGGVRYHAKVKKKTVVIDENFKGVGLQDSSEETDPLLAPPTPQPMPPPAPSSDVASSTASALGIKETTAPEPPAFEFIDGSSGNIDPKLLATEKEEPKEEDFFSMNTAIEDPSAASQSVDPVQENIPLETESTTAKTQTASQPPDDGLFPSTQQTAPQDDGLFASTPQASDDGLFPTTTPESTNLNANENLELSLEPQAEQPLEISLDNSTSNAPNFAISEQSNALSEGSLSEQSNALSEDSLSEQSNALSEDSLSEQSNALSEGSLSEQSNALSEDSLSEQSNALSEDSLSEQSNALSEDSLSGEDNLLSEDSTTILENPIENETLLEEVPLSEEEILGQKVSLTVTQCLMKISLLKTKQEALNMCNKSFAPLGISFENISSQHPEWSEIIAPILKKIEKLK